MSSRAQTLNSLFRLATKWKGTDILFADEMEQCSGEHAGTTVCTLACGLLSLGVQRKDRIAFLCDSSVRHALTFFACQKIGAIPCALHVRSTVAGICKTLEWLDARALVVDRKYREPAKEALTVNKLSIPIIVLDQADSVDSELSYDEIATSPVAGRETAAVEMDEPAMIILSSGTTGEPKGIVHSQRTLYASALSGQYVFGHIGAEDSIIIAMSPSFAAWNHVTFPYLACRAKIVFNRGFDPELFIRTLDRERITNAALVPIAWRRVLSAVGKMSTCPLCVMCFFQENRERLILLIL